MYSRCVYICWYVTCIDVASQICRIMKSEFSRVVNWPHSALLLLTPRYRTGWHMNKKGFIFSFFMSSCPKNQWDFQDYNVRRFISYFFPPQKVLVARQWKLPTWLIFTGRQSRNPERWYARSPFSLYHYHVSISYYIPPLAAMVVGEGRGAKKEKRHAWFVWIQAKDISRLREKTNEHKNPKENKSTDVIYYPPACVILSGERQLNMMERRHSDWKEVILDFRFLYSSIVFPS